MSVTPIFKCTDKAVKMAKQKLLEASEPVLGLRVGVRGGGCSGASYAIEYATKKRSNDLLFEFDGLAIYIDAKSMKVLDGVTLDWEEKLLGYGFKFINPNIDASCGCGTSFAV